MPRTPKPKYVRWDELSDLAKRRLLSGGHPSNRPKPEDQRASHNRFAEDGSAWMDAYLLANIFKLPR